MKQAEAAFEEAQAEILTSAPPRFTLTDPPSLGWWRARFDLNLASVVFLYYYQSILGRAPVAGPDGHAWQVDVSPRWQAHAGITPRQWEGVKAQLSENGIPLLAFTPGVVPNGLRRATRGVLIRPRDELLSVFGVTVKVFDAVAALDAAVARRLVAMGTTERSMPSPSADELQALKIWADAGGIERLSRHEHLAPFLQSQSAPARRLMAPGR